MSDLTKEEQVHVRTALRFLRSRCGGWDAVARALQIKATTLAHMIGERPPSVSVALRVARLAGVAVDDVLNGRYPAPGTCPYCGHRPESGTEPPAR